MALYETIVDAYDELFPPAESAKAFLGTPAKNGALAIDAGCATGAHAAMLAGLGWSALGLDPSGGMIEAAMERRGGQSGVSFATGGMMDLDRFAPSSGTSLILCAGNTLPHLHGMEELGAFMAKAARILEPGGRLVLQLLNYSKILRERPTALPDIHAGRWIFKRSYAYPRDGSVEFMTELEDSQSRGRVVRDTTRLWPFTVPDVTAMALADGFSVSGAYSSWSKEPFDEASSAVALLDLVFL